MAREICKLNLVVVDEGDRTTASAELQFEGTGRELADVFVHIFNAFELSPKEAILLSSLAAARINEAEVSPNE